jgi:DNA-binding MarR family transcriptional regulator
MTDQAATQATELDHPRLQRKVRRILAALHLADRPLTAAELIRATSHSAGNVFFTLYRLERAGWINRSTGVEGPTVYGLTSQGRRHAGFVLKETQSPPGVREVRIVVQAPSEENADRWAETIRDLVVAEYGDSMRLEVTILPGGRA